MRADAQRVTTQEQLQILIIRVAPATKTQYNCAVTDVSEHIDPNGHALQTGGWTAPTPKYSTPIRRKLRNEAKKATQRGKAPIRRMLRDKGYRTT